MRLSLIGVALCAAGLSVAALTAAPASAATGPSILNATDPKGDARGGQADTDIVGVTFLTSGTTKTKRVGSKTTKVYTPTQLTVRLALDAPPSELPVMNFAVEGETNACGAMSLYYDGQQLAGGGFFSSCGELDPVTGLDSVSFDEPVVAGSVISWSVPFASLPRELTTNASISDIHAYVSVNEPLTGLGTSFVTSAGNIDDLVVDATYKIG